MPPFTSTTARYNSCPHTTHPTPLSVKIIHQTDADDDDDDGMHGSNSEQTREWENGDERIWEVRKKDRWMAQSTPVILSLSIPVYLSRPSLLWTSTCVLRSYWMDQRQWNAIISLASALHRLDGPLRILRVVTLFQPPVKVDGRGCHLREGCCSSGEKIQSAIWPSPRSVNIVRRWWRIDNEHMDGRLLPSRQRLREGRLREGRLREGRLREGNVAFTACILQMLPPWPCASIDFTKKCSFKARRNIRDTFFHFFSYRLIYISESVFFLYIYNGLAGKIEGHQTKKIDYNQVPL